MIVVMRHGAPREQLDAVLTRIAQDALAVHVFEGEERVVIAILGEVVDDALQEALLTMPGVQEVSRTTRPYRLASREARGESSRVRVGAVTIGDRLVLGAGAARLHAAEELVLLARSAMAAGAELFWLGRPKGADLAQALPLVARLRSSARFPLVVDVWGPDEIDPLMTYCDGLIVAGQHLQSYPLLRALARSQHPVLLCRGLATSVEEWLMAAEELLRGGNFNVVMVEQGIRTFETAARSTLDFSAVAVLKRLSHLPVAVNPSLAAGRRDLVSELALGAIGAGADAVLVDVHLGLEDERVAGPQAMDLAAFAGLAARARRLSGAMAGLA